MTYFCPYVLYTLRTFAIRTSVHDVLLSIRTFVRTYFIPYVHLLYVLLSMTYFCPYVLYTLRTFAIRTFVHDVLYTLRTFAIRTFVLRTFADVHLTYGH